VNALLLFHIRQQPFSKWGLVLARKYRFNIGIQNFNNLGLIMNTTFSRHKRRLSTLALSSLLLSLTLSANTSAQGLPAEVVRASEQNVPTYIEAVGTLKANESLILRPEITGRVQKITFSEGHEVNKNATLVQFDASMYRARVNEAKARVKLSEAEYQRVNKLFKNGAISETQRDSALAQMQINEAQLEQSQVSLEKMTLRAPFTGIVGLRQFSPGDYITAGADMLEIVDINSMKLDFRIPEIYLPQVAQGQTLSINLSAFPGEAFEGKVTAISPQISEQGRNILVRALLPNKDKKLRPGLFAKVQLLVKQENLIVIPEEAIIPQGKGFLVYIYKDDKVTPMPVQLGQRMRGSVVISGINVGDVVITAGQLKLQPGSPITPIFVDGSAPAPDSGKKQPAGQE
jgi:membrane fusion protein (multidrug efflux system)